MREKMQKTMERAIISRHRYAETDCLDSEVLPFSQWEEIENTGLSIFKKDFEGAVYFLKESYSARYKNKLSIFSERLVKGVSHKNGNFYIKVEGTPPLDNLKKFIELLGRKLFFHTKNIELYSIVDIKQEAQSFYLLEFSYMSLFDMLPNGNGKNQALIYKELLYIIDGYLNEERFCLKIDTTIYDYGTESYFEYYKPTVTIIKIEKNILCSYKIRIPTSYAVLCIIRRYIRYADRNIFKEFYWSCAHYRNVLNCGYDTFTFHLNCFYFFIKSICRLKSCYRKDSIYLIAQEKRIPAFKCVKGREAILCKDIGCIFFKEEEPCKQIQSPFNFINERIAKQTNGQQEHFDISSDSYNCRLEKNIFTFYNFHSFSGFTISFFLLFFCTNVISRCRFSIYDEKRNYSNLSPLILNFDNDTNIDVCKDTLSILREFYVNECIKIKSYDILQKIKIKECFSIIDELSGRFSVLQIAQSNILSTKKCLENILRVGSFKTNTVARINTFVLSYNNALNKLIADKPRIIQNKLANFLLIDFHAADLVECCEDNLYKYILGIDMFLSKNGPICIEESIELKCCFEDLYLKNKCSIFHDKTRNKNLFYTTYIFVLLFKIGINGYDEIVHEAHDISLAAEIVTFITDRMKRSYPSHFEKERDYEKKLYEMLFSRNIRYISRREIFRKFNSSVQNKELNRAIENLLRREDLFEVHSCFVHKRGRRSAGFYCISRRVRRDKKKISTQH